MEMIDMEFIEDLHKMNQDLIRIREKIHNIKSDLKSSPDKALFEDVIINLAFAYNYIDGAIVRIDRAGKIYSKIK